ncbi:DUF2635 domain-containing protein [Pseudomonas aeruginosa]|nr:DUF2635 domain-containing protein [Pseudomonas aeruginosa]MBG4236942.1 DUF2635 domain-containing protein [Pseudomonas aeruginosa]MBX6105065.1 DUF2635 domain-containing protein [Pseudomonas aeruginosa]
MNVIAAPGLQVPLEDKPREYITDSKARSVPDRAYYHRRIAAGELLLVGDSPAEQAEPSTSTAKPRAKARTE